MDSILGLFHVLTGDNAFDNLKELQDSLLEETNPSAVDEVRDLLPISMLPVVLGVFTSRVMTSSVDVLRFEALSSQQVSLAVS